MTHAPVRDSRRTRLAWLDIARGVLVIFVVVGHAVFFMARRGMDLTDVGPAVRLVQEVRIPALFFLSGMLFVSASTRPWRQLLRGRGLLLGWLLVVWLAIELVVRNGIIGVDEVPTLAQSPRWLLGQLALPEDYLWFIWGLLVMVLLGRLLGRHPWAMLVVFVAMTTTGLSWFPDLGRQTEAFVTRAPFFLLGLAVVPIVLRLRQRHLVLLAVPATGLFLLGANLRVAGRTGPLNPETASMLVAVAGLPVVVGIAVLLARVPGSGVLRFFGQRTLPVYIMHMPVLLLLFREMRRSTRPWSDDNAVLAMVLLVSLTVAICLATWWVTARFGLRGLFDVPHVVTRGFDALWPARTAQPVKVPPPHDADLDPLRRGGSTDPELVLEVPGGTADRGQVRRPLPESASCPPAPRPGQPPPPA